MSPALAATAAFVVTVVATPLAARVAKKAGVVDRPGALKVHRQPVPYLGGIAVLAGLLTPMAISRPAFLLPLVGAAAVGLVDDVRDMPPSQRLMVEVAIGATAAVLVPTRLGAAGGLLVIGATVALINAVNFIDGLDGLAAGTVTSASVVFALALDGPERGVALAVAGATLGFLVHNWPPASIYLGDAGAYLLGASLAVLVAVSWSGDRPLGTSVGVLAVVAVPAAELVTTVIRRARTGDGLFAGDRMHLYDRLHRRGLSLERLVVVYAGTTACVGLAGVGAGKLTTTLATATMALACLSVAVATARIGTERPAEGTR